MSHLINPCLARPTISSFRGQRKWQRRQLLRTKSWQHGNTGRRERGRIFRRRTGGWGVGRCSLCKLVGLTPKVHEKKLGIVPCTCNSGEAIAGTPWTISLYLCICACNYFILLYLNKCVLAVHTNRLPPYALPGYSLIQQQNRGSILTPSLIRLQISKSLR